MKPILPLIATLLGSCAAEVGSTVPPPPSSAETRTTGSTSPRGETVTASSDGTTEVPVDDPTDPPNIESGCSAIESACAGGRCDPNAVAGRRPLRRERGRVSYYADRFQGRRTASGDVFDQRALTAASRNLPFGALVRVRRVDHPERVVIVRVNDRGPFGRNGRILDLSRAAAECIDMIRSGVVEVDAEVLDWGPRGRPN